MKHKHNNISDDLTRQKEEQYNEEFFNSLQLNFDINQFEGKENKDIGNDSTPYMTVWLKNIDRLMGLISSDIKLENYHLCDVGCGLGISTIYFQKKYNMKSYLLFMFNPFGIDTMQNFINNNLDVFKENKSIILYANDLHINEIKGYEKINRDDYFNLSALIF